MFTKILRKLVKGESNFDPNGLPLLGQTDRHAQAGNAGEAEQSIESTILCRDAILDIHQKTCGHELSLRLKKETHSVGQAIHERQLLAEHALVYQVTDAFRNDRLASTILFLSLLPESLHNEGLDELPGQRFVIVLHGWDTGADHADKHLARISALSELGFKFAYRHENDTEFPQALTSVVDHIAIDVRATGFEAWVQKLQHVSGTRTWHFLAQNVSDDETFAACALILNRFAGTHWYQGGFVTAPQPWRQDPIDVGKSRVIDLLNAIQQQKENNILVEGMRRDPILLSRLLRFVNTAAATRSGRVSSAEQALMILGRERLYCWLTVLLFCSGEVAERDLAVMNVAMIRARFAELLGVRHFDRRGCEHLFLVGMFSLLDILFRVRMRDALRPLELPRAVLEALLGREGPYAQILDLVIACETRDQDRLALCADRCSLEDEFINECHTAAICWAQEVARQ